MSEKKINTKNNIIIPQDGGFVSKEERRELFQELESVAPEDVDLAIEQQRKEQEQIKRNLDPEKMTSELPHYTQEVRYFFLELKWIDEGMLEKIDEIVLEMENNWYIKRCSYDWGLMVMIDIPWYPLFKYFEPNLKKHSLGGGYKWCSPYCVGNIINFWWIRLAKNEIVYGSLWRMPLKKGSDMWLNFPLYYYLKELMEKTGFSFVSFQHDRKFLKILWEYYEKFTWSVDISIPELIAMRTRVLLSWGYRLEQDERWYNQWMIGCNDDFCGFPLLGPLEFNYVSFFLTDMELLTEDFQNRYVLGNYLG